MPFYAVILQYQTKSYQKVMNISKGNLFTASASLQGGFAISATDEVFATALQFGRTVLDATFSGIGSLQQLIAEVVKVLGTVTGLVTIMVRNRTQGTVTRKVVRLGARHRSAAETPVDGMQLSLPL